MIKLLSKQKLKFKKEIYIYFIITAGLQSIKKDLKDLIIYSQMVFKKFKINLINKIKNTLFYNILEE